MGVKRRVTAPPALASFEAAPALIQKIQAEVNLLKRSDSVPPALAEQFDIQMTALKDDMAPGLEIMIFPGLFSFTGKYKPTL